MNADGMVGANGDLVGYNLFAYCSNNPVRFVDPSGMVILKALTVATLIKIAVATVAVAAVGYVAINHGDEIVTDIKFTVDAYKRDLILIDNILIRPRDNIIDINKIHEKVKEKEKTKVEDKTKTPPAMILQYYVPVLVGNKIIMGQPLSYSQARERASLGQNVLCISQAAAIAVVSFFPGSVGPEKSGGFASDFLWHYHINRSISKHNPIDKISAGHIWFYGEPVIK